MKLFYSTASPYARKVLVAAHEAGLIERLCLCLTDPWSDPEELLAVNPVGKVPALLCDDGRVVTESTTICEFLDGLTETGPLTGGDGMAALVRTALAEGVIDAAFAAAIERRRPPERQWRDWVDRQVRAIERTLSAIEVPPGERFDLGDVALACALGYLDFRHGDIGWRDRHAALGRWFDEAAQRPSMRATRP